MEAPALSLAPPRQRHATPSPSSSTVSSGPQFSSSATDERGSSDTNTITTIYSMYGSDEVRASWTASALEERPEELDQENYKYPNILYQSNRYTTASDTMFIDLSTTDGKPASKISQSFDIARNSTFSNGSAHLSHPRPVSSTGALSANGKDVLQPPRHSRTLSGEQRSHSVGTSISVSTGFETARESTSFSRSPVSRPSSPHRRQSSLKHGELVLALTPAESAAPSSYSPGLSEPQTSSLTPAPYISPSSPGYQQTSRLNEAVSKTSLVPSEGEDQDAFLVRSTYAQLEMTGVKGDGYEEGIERTRARVGRLSEIRAQEALGNSAEKSRELNAAEIDTLQSLDRYGFLSQPSHDRLILLPSAPFSKRLGPVHSGPKNASSHAVSVEALPPATPFSYKEESRIAKWGRMLEVRTRDRGGNTETWGIKASKERKLRRRTYKGIPDRWRTAAWEVLMGRFSHSGRNEMLKLERDYEECLGQPSSYDIQIDLDVPRTISGHILFRTRYGWGQRSLFHVLHSFSLRCALCGYVQGMGPIAATLLCYFSPSHVYAGLVRIHDAYCAHSIFSPGFPGLLEAIYVQERITELNLPDVYQAFKKHMISTTSYATKWYITLFANSVPFQTQLRMWDVFLLEGQDVFVAVAVAIIWVYRDQITSASASFETILSLLSSVFVPESEDALLLWIEQMLGDHHLRSKMEQWRKDWKNLVATGQDSKALL